MTSKVDPHWPKQKLSKNAVAALYKKLSQDIPNPKTELHFTNNYTLLVAVVLSAQATDKGVNKATATLFEKVDHPKQMVALGYDGLVTYIKSIGLYQSKAKHVISLSRDLLDKHDGEVPSDRESLEALDGVGRKTASVVMNEAFGQPTIAVDTHIFRVSNRTGLAPGKTPNKVEKMLEYMTPAEYKKGAHHWLILHGRYICVARMPKCVKCSISDICKYKNKNSS